MGGRTYRRTDGRKYERICKNNDHYLPWLRVGLVNQNRLNSGMLEFIQFYDLQIFTGCLAHWRNSPTLAIFNSGFGRSSRLSKEHFSNVCKAFWLWYWRTDSNHKEKCCSHSRILRIHAFMGNFHSTLQVKISLDIFNFSFLILKFTGFCW